jgi:hypothetical protein
MSVKVPPRSIANWNFILDYDGPLVGDNNIEAMWAADEEAIL